MDNQTPMLKQYFEVKKQYPHAILFFRLGDFYEMFGDDAQEASHILGITLTARGRGSEHEIPMCGVPHHAAENYIVKLTKAGKNVAICEQLSLPGRGIVDRNVTQVITPGTTLNKHALDEKKHNFVAFVCFDEKHGTQAGCAIADVGTGDFFAAEVDSPHDLLQIVFRLAPSEMVTLPSFQTRAAEVVKRCKSIVLNIHEPPFLFDPYLELLSHFKVKTLHGFGVEKTPFALRAAGLLLHYIKETQKADIAHITRLREYRVKDFLTLDETTLYNLELLATMHGSSRIGSLIDVLDRTKTAMGGRTLQSWLLHPLLSKKKIVNRHRAVAFLKDEADTSAFSRLLAEINDIERITAKVGLARAHAKDLVGLTISLKNMRTLQALFPPSIPPLLATINTHLGNFDELINYIDASIKDDPPYEITEGNIIKDGYDQKLDELRTLTHDAKKLLNEIVAQEIQKTGITSLKLKYTSVFGYFLEVSRANLDKVPPQYIRKQTLVHAERFITPELKELEEKILTAQEKIITHEYELFCEIRKKTSTYIPALQKASRAVGALDVLVSFAQTALYKKFVQPEMVEDGSLVIEKGRHPVIETLLTDELYIPNDTRLEDQRILLLTGPNMSGKSSYLRQTALITLMAHIGSFVPAEKARISITDRIFTRVGASDNLAFGQSTFMVEMQETSRILHNATPKSLIILDELGRGTSTYDGLSLAWATLEYIHDHIGAKTLFATHYHELIDVAEKLPRAKNLSFAVAEHEGRVIFLHHVQEGGTQKSFGIEVAKLAGVPDAVIFRAQALLAQLEKAHAGQLPLPSFDHSQNSNALSLQEQKILDTLKTVDVNRLTPLEALNLIQKLKEKIE